MCRSPTSPAIAFTGISLASAITSASNNNVKLEPARAHGTRTCRTPCPAQITLGTRALRYASCWKKFKCGRVALGAVHLAASRTALRAREASALAKVDQQIWTPPLGIEPNIDHLPRLLKTRSSGEQAEIGHTELPSSRNRSPAESQPDRTATHSEHRRAQKYLTVVVDQHTGRLVWGHLGRDRKTTKTVLDLLGQERCQRITPVSCDEADWIAPPSSR